MSESALVGAIGKRIIKISLNMSFVQRSVQLMLVLNFLIRKGETLFLWDVKKRSKTYFDFFPAKSRTTGQEQNLLG